MPLGVLDVRAAQPVPHFRIDLTRRREADLEPHGLVNLRRSESPSRALPLEAQPEVDPRPGGRLDAAHIPAALPRY